MRGGLHDEKNEYLDRKDYFLGNKNMIWIGYSFFVIMQLANIYAAANHLLPDTATLGLFIPLTLSQVAHAVGTMVYGPMHDR